MPPFVQSMQNGRVQLSIRPRLAIASAKSPVPKMNPA
jgi:hypothetical protein